MADPRQESPALETEQEHGEKTGLTLRAMLIGVSFTGFLCVCCAHSEWVVGSSLLVHSYFPIGFVVPLFFFVAVLNPFLKLVRKRWALTERELAVIVIMALCACPFAQRGMIINYFSTASAPYYYASPENRWAENFHAYLPTWLIPTDRKALTWFFEGKPPGASIPWSAWLTPLFWWLTLCFAVAGAYLCILVVFRKQWMTNERMTYPLAEIPLTMIAHSEDARLLPAFMRSKMFWTGFGFISLIMIWNFIGYWLPMLPKISWRLPSVRFGRSFPSIRLVASPFVVSVSFLLRLDLSFSIWFFYLLTSVQLGVFNRLGVPLGGDPIGYDARPPAAAYQEFGGFVVLAASGIWVARRHLVQFVRKAVGLRSDVDDREELLSCRAAILGFLILSAYCVVFLWRSGMSWHVALIFICFIFLVLLTLTRAVMEAGLVFVAAPLSPQTFITDMLGTNALSPHTLTSIGLSYALYNHPQVNLMPFLAHSMKIGHSARLKPRTVLTCMAISLTAAATFSTIVLMWITHKFGAYSLRSWMFYSHPHRVFSYLVKTMNNPAGINTLKLKYLSGGIAFTAILMILRYRYSWFPFNPLGFPLARVHEIKLTAVSIFIGWFIKLVILKLGGARVYEKAKPFFIGALLAYLTSAVMSYVIDALFFRGGPSHPIYPWQ